MLGAALRRARPAAPEPYRWPSNTTMRAPGSSRGRQLRGRRPERSRTSTPHRMRCRRRPAGRATARRDSRSCWHVTVSTVESTIIRVGIAIPSALGRPPPSSGISGTPDGAGEDVYVDVEKHEAGPCASEPCLDRQGCADRDWRHAMLRRSSSARDVLLRQLVARRPDGVAYASRARQPPAARGGQGVPPASGVLGRNGGTRDLAPRQLRLRFRPHRRPPFTSTPWRSWQAPPMRSWRCCRRRSTRTRTRRHGHSCPADTTTRPSSPSA